MRFGSLGDVILSSAPLLNLRISFPEAEIVYLTRERYAPLVEGFYGIDDVVVLGNDASGPELIKLLLDLDHRAFDAVVDLHGNIRSWLGRQLIAAPFKTVYPKRRLERRRIVKKNEIPDDWPHTIELYNRAVEEIGGSVPAMRPIIRVQANNRMPDAVTTLFQRHGTVAVIAPGAAHENKRWPMEQFVRTAEGIHQRHGDGIVWAVTGSDAGKADVSGMPAESCVELVDCPIPELARVISMARFTVANDSGIMHLSSAVGTPVVAIFGPTHPSLGFSPAGLHDRVVEVDEYCRPCSLHGAKPCFREERFCFTRIEAGQVLAEAADVFQATRNRRPALFIDRDGTLIVEKHFLDDPDLIEFERGAVEAIKRGREKGYKIVIVSNQSGVARGRFGIPTVERINARLLERLAAEGAPVDALYYCPHHPRGKVAEFAVSCGCRKPAAGMAEQAAVDLGLDLRRSYVIGDKADDVNLAAVFGGRGILVRTGYGLKHEPIVGSVRLTDRVAVADDVLAAVEIVDRMED